MPDPNTHDVKQESEHENSSESTTTHVPSDASESTKLRSDFLQKMYTQMFDDIKVQLQIVWQSVAVVASTFGLFALVEKGAIPLDVAAGVIVLIAIWLIAHVNEASYWYNRNLVIIANIERQFLRADDLHDIQYYFGRHRKAGEMIYHLRIQFLFGLGMVALVLLYHFSDRVAPGIREPLGNFEVKRSIPYCVALMGAVLIFRQMQAHKVKYREFLGNSPGISVEAQGIHYGKGHPQEKTAADGTKR